MTRNRSLLAFLIFLVLSFLACQKREPATPTTGSGPVGIQAPEEPVLHLAWMAAGQIQMDLQQLGQPLVLKMLPLENTAGIPAGAAEYFQAALVTRLQTFGLLMPGDATIQLQSSLYWLRNQLVYGMKLRKGDQVLMTDTASIAHDDRLDNTLAQFQPQGGHEGHMHHAEALIPTPVARLDEAPLDVGQDCAGTSGPCDIVLLYADRIEILNWKTLATRIKKFPPELTTTTRSRAPSGKFLRDDTGYTVLSNNLSGALHYDFQWNVTTPAVTKAALPRADSGLNTYSLGDGHFSDFEPLAEGGMVVVETNHHLSVARSGALVTATNPAGSAVAVRWPAIYTSAPVLPDLPDSIQKYTFQDGNLVFDSSRPVVGSVVDLTITDLNRDGIPELLVTLQRPEGVFIEVWEVF